MERGEEIQEAKLIEAAEQVAGSISALKDNRRDKVPEWSDKDWWKNNPFGAELSTLIRMEADGKWTPDQDSITLLTSDTQVGMWCGKAINIALTGIYDIEVQLRKIIGLKEDFESGKNASISLVDALRCNLKPTDKWKNVFMITGGFKSLLPVMTVAAMLYGFSLVYLYEKSTYLQQEILVDLTDHKKMEKWQKTWDGWNEKWCGLTPWLKRLLDIWHSPLEKISRPDVEY